MTAMHPPTGRRVHVVCWRRQGVRPDVRMRYFTRRYDAELYADKLRGYGKDVTVYVSHVEWSAVPR